MLMLVMGANVKEIMQESSENFFLLGILHL